MTEASRRCAECGIILPLSSFNRNKGSKDGRRQPCRACLNATVIRNSPRGDRGTDEWRPVEDFGGIFRGIYEVSDLGRVWALPRRRTPGGILKQVLDGNYYKVGLCAGKTCKIVRVHILVATAFHGPCPPGMEVRHGPLGQQVNWASNLCYGTQSDNMMDRVRDGVSNRGERNWNSKLTPEIVLECRERYRHGESQQILAREFGVSHATISDLVVRRTWYWLA